MEFDLDRIGGPLALAALVQEVLAAGDEALEVFYSAAGRRGQAKPDRSPVTEADRRVEQRLRSFLTERFPEAGFLGEETGSADPDASLRFIVDPIDGTRAFVRGLGTWSILVGLEADSEAAIGIAHFPVSGDLFVAVRGHGAQANGRPARVSQVDALDAALICHGGLQQFTEAGLGRLLLALGEQTYTQRGFADFDGYRQLLLGRADAMLDPGVKPWDVCAAAVLVREAGGTFTSLQGQPTIHGGSGLASNGHLHQALLDLVRSSQPR
jgi:histidinol-phosphatase